MQEVWKDIPDYEGYYKISSYGRIKTVNNKIIKCFINNNNYYEVVLFKDYKKRHHRLHRLVADAFVDNPNSYKCINHIDGNKLNNKVSNLEWCNHSYNIKHAFNNGLMTSKRSHRTKVNQYDLNGNFIKTWKSIAEIERNYSISHTAIRFCCIGKNKTAGGYIWRYAIH